MHLNKKQVSDLIQIQTFNLNNWKQFKINSQKIISSNLKLTKN
jgi:hypothetical protein